MLMNDSAGSSGRLPVRSPEQFGPELTAEGLVEGQRRDVTVSIRSLVRRRRTCFARPKLYVKEGFEATTERFFIPSLSLNYAKIN